MEHNKESAIKRLKIGQITHLHGIKGEVFLSLLAEEKELAQLIEGKCIEISWDKPPAKAPKKQEFLVQKASNHKQGLILQLKGINTLQKALSLKKALVFAPKKLFQSAKGDKIYLCEVLDFTVFNVPKNPSTQSPATSISGPHSQKSGEGQSPSTSKQKPMYIGQVFAFSHNGAQDLLQVKNQERFLNQTGFLQDTAFAGSPSCKVDMKHENSNQTSIDSDSQKDHKIRSSCIAKKSKKQSLQKATSFVNSSVMEIPFIPKFILKVDFKTKTLYVHLPKGWPKTYTSALK